MKSNYSSDDDEPQGYESTVLDIANIEIMDVGDEPYRAENGNFMVEREAEDRFVLEFDEERHTFTSAQDLINHLR